MSSAPKWKRLVPVNARRGHPGPGDEVGELADQDPEYRVTNTVRAVKSIDA